MELDSILHLDLKHWEQQGELYNLVKDNVSIANMGQVQAKIYIIITFNQLKVSTHRKLI